MLLTMCEALCEFKKNFPQVLPQVKIQKTKFFALKPSHIQCVSELKQIGCLCKVCENMKLYFVAMKAEMSEQIGSIHDFINCFKCFSEDEILCENGSCELCIGNAQVLLYEMFEEENLGLDVELLQWTQDGHRMKLKSGDVTIIECVERFLSQLKEYKQHIYVKRTQSQLFKRAILNSSGETIVIEVDFSENFKCVSQKIQSAHFHQQAVAIFTVCIWSGEEKFSKVFITDDTSQNKFCVYTFLDLIIKDIKAFSPIVKKVLIFPDGCAGQFRTRWTLSNVLFAIEDFGVEMTWDFFAPGHGKGAVDGVGGTIKRTVQRRIMGGHSRVYCAKEFAECAAATVQGISSTFVEVDKIQETEKWLSIRWAKIRDMAGITKFYSFHKLDNKTIGASLTGNETIVKQFLLLDAENDKRPKRNKFKNH